MLQNVTKGMITLAIALGSLGVLDGAGGVLTPRANAQIRREIREVRWRERRLRHERWHVERRLHRNIRHERHEIHRDRAQLHRVRR
jgi:hypothetical protein